MLTLADQLATLVVDHATVLTKKKGQHVTYQASEKQIQQVKKILEVNMEQIRANEIKRQSEDMTVSERSAIDFEARTV